MVRLLVVSLIMLLRSGRTIAGTIRSCTGTKCMLCKTGMLDTDPVTRNYLRNEDFTTQLNFNCESSNIVYVISCKEEGCDFQYIGKTKQTLRARMNGHRSSLRTKKGCPVFIKHFTTTHSPKSLKVKPLDVNTSKDLEMNMIKKFGTLYPYGGNDRLDTPYLDAVEHFESGKPVFNLFNHVRSSRNKRGGRKRNPSNQTVESPSPTEVIQRIKCSKRDGQNYRHLAKILINGSQKSSVCELLKLSGEIDDKWLRNIIVDLCRHYFCRERKMYSIYIHQ